MMTGSGMGMSGAIWMIIFWLAIIVGGIWLLASIFPKMDSSSRDRFNPNDNPLTILKRRYARGELSKEEFEAIRRDLE